MKNLMERTLEDMGVRKAVTEGFGFVVRIQLWGLYRSSGNNAWHIGSFYTEEDAEKAKLALEKLPEYHAYDKIASSLDGATALHNGNSKWITGPAAREHGHTWRARSCALLSGVGTVLSDDPLLNVRFVSTPRQPKLILIDAALDTPQTAALFKEKREVIIYCAEAPKDKEKILTELGATIVVMADAQNPKHVDLRGMLQDLGKREINELHIEAGAGLNSSFIQQGLVDEFLIYLAPLLLADAKGWTTLPPLESLDQGKRLTFLETTPLAQDIFIRARPALATVQTNRA